MWKLCMDTWGQDTGTRGRNRTFFANDGPFLMRDARQRLGGSCRIASLCGFFLSFWGCYFLTFSTSAPFGEWVKCKMAESPPSGIDMRAVFLLLELFLFCLGIVCRLREYVRLRQKGNSTHHVPLPPPGPTLIIARHHLSLWLSEISKRAASLAFTGVRIVRPLHLHTDTRL